MTGYRTPATICPSCGRTLDAAQNLQDAQPTPGDFSICLECGHLMTFADDLSLRSLTREEEIEIAGNKDLLEVQAFRAHCLAWRKEKKR